MEERCGRCWREGKRREGKREVTEFVFRHNYRENWEPRETVCSVGCESVPVFKPSQVVIKTTRLRLVRSREG